MLGSITLLAWIQGTAATTLNDAYMLFTGQISLDAGANVFTITHDDGLQLNIDGISEPIGG